MAKKTFKADVRWSGKGVLCNSTVRNFQVAMDEPVALGGADTAMNPVELLLSAFGGCLTICAAAFAGHCHVELRDVQVEVEGDLDPDGFTGKSKDVRTGLLQIRYRIHIDSPSPQANVERLKRLMLERCPISDTLKGVPITEM